MTRAIEQIVADVRYALRVLRRRPLVSSAAVLTLGVAIAANSVIFSFIHALVLEPLPFARPDRVVFVYSRNAQRGVAHGPLSLPDFLDGRDAVRSFEELAASDLRSYALTSGDRPERVLARRASVNLFRAWGLDALVGRTFLARDDESGAPPVAVLSHSFWSARFGADPAAIGGTVVLDAVPHRIVGVLGPDIEIGVLREVALWTPLPRDDPAWSRQARTLQVTGRLRPGVPLTQAGAELAAVSARLASTHPVSNAGWQLVVVPLSEALTVPENWLVLGLATLIVGLVLALACANVAGLQMAQGVERRAEVAVRLAVGASRWRVGRQLLLEGALLALAAGAAGLGLAGIGLAAIKSVTYDAFYEQVVIDRGVFGFTVAVSLVTPLLFSLGPAAGLLRRRISADLTPGRLGSLAALRSSQGRGALVAGQVAVSVILVMLAVLAVRSALVLAQAELGFDPARIWTLRLDLPEPSYDGPVRVTGFHQRLLDELAVQPGVEHVGVTSRLPLIDRSSPVTIAIEGHVARAGEEPWATVTAVSSELLDALSVPLLAGRHLSRDDDRADRHRVVISRELVTRYWADAAAAIGARIRIDPSRAGDPWREVVGVVADVRHTMASDAIAPQVYVPLPAAAPRTTVVLVRATGDPAGLAARVRDTVRSLDPALAVYDERTLPDALDVVLAHSRMVGGLFATFSVVATLLAATGLFSLLWFAVVQGAGEIGLRLALGARPAGVAWLVLRRGAAVTITGLAVGLLVAIPLARAAGGAFRGVDPASPTTAGGAVALLLGVALLAGIVPAWRTATVDPACALRHE